VKRPPRGAAAPGSSGFGKANLAPIALRSIGTLKTMKIAPARIGSLRARPFPAGRAGQAPTAPATSCRWVQDRELAEHPPTAWVLESADGAGPTAHSQRSGRRGLATGWYEAPLSTGHGWAVGLGFPPCCVGSFTPGVQTLLWRATCVKHV
jgi:hypothetical protein